MNTSRLAGMARTRPLTLAWQNADQDDYDLSEGSTSRLATLVARATPAPQAADDPFIARWVHARASAAAQAQGLRAEARILGTAIAAAEQDVAAEVVPRAITGWLGALQANAADK